MRAQEARRVLIAAQDDPVVAAWTWVLHEHKVAAPTEVSPYEAWDAFQALHDAGVVPTDIFDAQQGSFFNRRPPQGQLESALTNLRILPEVDALEDTTVKDLFKKPKDNNSLEKTTPQTSTLGSPLRKGTLGPPISRPMVSSPSFRPPGVSAPAAQKGISFGARVSEGSALPCVSNGGGGIPLKESWPCIRRGCQQQVTVRDCGLIDIAENEIAALAGNGSIQMSQSAIELMCPDCGAMLIGMVASVQQ